MRSHTTKRFRDAFAAPPQHVRRQAKEAYKLFERSPQHPSLRFKPVHATRPIRSVRSSADYRALGVRQGDEIIWFWIGSHADHDRLLARRGRPGR